jgi:hypothetical protein
VDVAELVEFLEGGEDGSEGVHDEIDVLLSISSISICGKLL